MLPLARSVCQSVVGLSVLCLSVLCLTTTCGGTSADHPAAAASSLVHLVDDLETASVSSAVSPAAARQARSWSFAEPRDDWRPVSNPRLAAVERTPVGDALRLTVPGPSFTVGGLEVALDGLTFSDWETVVVQARTHDRFAGVRILYNLADSDVHIDPGEFFASPDEAPPLFSDGSVQSYAIPLRPREGESAPEQLTSLGVIFAALGTGSVDILSVTLVPRGASYVDDVGTRRIPRDGTTRQTLFAHTPAEIAWPVELVPDSRLDVGLAATRGERVTYTLSVERAGQRELLLEETVDDPEAWHQHSLDLSGHTDADRIVFEATSALPGAVALWGTPILSSGDGTQDGRPDVIFYVIDGGDADFMSAFGYDRPTTPFLEELAREGVLFTRAHSNASWTQPSTVSFMTSLQHSVLGGLRRGIHSTSVPAGAVTLADHFRRAGYQTASFTANPNAGRLIGTDQGMDWMRDVETAHHSTSSLELHERFAELRREYPGGPTFVHFQTTDVHEPNEPEAPFAGRLVSEQQRQSLDDWEGQLWQAAGNQFGTTDMLAFYNQALDKAGIDRAAYYGVRRDLYAETMMHQDAALRQLVAELKASGAWQRTVLVLGSDHGHPAGTFARFGRGLLDPRPEPWQSALCDSYATGVPLLIVWPGHIAGGRVVDEPVSMLDVLPTLLELVGLPPAEVAQGQSLAPLLRGEEQELRPVVLDEFRVDEASGEMIGNLEIIDGRWGASLEIGPLAEGADPSLGRHPAPAGGRWGAVHPYFPDAPRLLLYDLEQDPFATHAVNDEHPDLVKRYTRQLRDLWQAHRALAQQFGAGERAPMTPDQLEQLQALGYIR